MLVLEKGRAFFLPKIMGEIPFERQQPLYFISNTQRAIRSNPRSWRGISTAIAGA
jgi:hypothetical protein